MRKFPFFLIIALAITSIACSSDIENVWEKYREWREINEQWFVEQQSRLDENGDLYYTKVSPKWNPSRFVLVHYFNDRNATTGNLSPLYTSTVDVKYIGRLYNDEAFDSSYNNTAVYGDSIFRTTCSNVISGWTAVLEDMRVGDSCEVVIPYSMGYGDTEGGAITPYSMLKFNIKLVNIPYYEAKP